MMRGPKSLPPKVKIKIPQWGGMRPMNKSRSHFTAPPFTGPANKPAGESPRRSSSIDAVLFAT
jgi:hypothetical protein